MADEPKYTVSYPTYKCPSCGHEYEYNLPAPHGKSTEGVQKCLACGERYILGITCTIELTPKFNVKADG